MYTGHIFYVRRDPIITRTVLASRHEWKGFVLEGAGHVCIMNVLRQCSTGDL
jgi:hypothetical protein